MRTLVFLAALLLAPSAFGQTLDDLRWLKGCWRTSGDTMITEVWSAPPMPAMLGYAYSVRDGRIVEWEQTRIEMIDDWPHFVAMPGGAAPVRFRLHAGGGANEARFDNAGHDYPQTVRYARNGDRLTATISMLDGSNPMSFEYRRIACAAALRP